MLKLKIMVVDRTRSPFLRDGEAHYLKRLGRYARVEWVEVKPARIKKGRPESDILNTEASSLEKRLTERDYLVALDRRGKEMDSLSLASWLERISAQARGPICFIIGGPLGLAPDLLKRADQIISLSKLTLTHEMTRLVLLEQLYRAGTILAGEKYHK